MEKVFDVHIHYLFDIPLEKTIEIFKKEFAETKTEKGCFLSVPHEAKDGIVGYEQTQNIKALYLKRAFAPNFYAFAGLVHPQDHTDEKAAAKDFLRQAETYFSVGYDGMKMLEGYPSLLKAWNVPLDSKIYDPYYSFMEENGYPITMHIANPKENWNIKSASPYAIQAGRVYDESYPTKDEITSQVFRIMEKHPNLKLALAHFGFMSYDIREAEAFMGYPNTLMDITPGGEQLLNMQEEWEKWLPFWEKYQDRILYGTDFYAFPDEDEEDWKTCFWRRPRFVRQLLETDTEHEYIDRKFHGVKLDESLRKKIYWDNAEKILGPPKKIDESYLVREAERLLALPQKESKFADEDLRYIKTSTVKILQNDKESKMDKKREGFKKPLKLLFIGNSATYVHDIPQTLSLLAGKAGYCVETKMIAKGGYELSQHANSSTEHGKLVLDEINNGYDIVFLQDNGNCVSSDEKRAASINACKVLDAAIRATGGDTYIYVRPPYGYEKAGRLPLEQCIEFDKFFGGISKQLGTGNVYVNRAFAYGMKNLEFDLWGPDHGHVSEYGAYLAVCVFFSTLFHTTSTVLESNGLPVEEARALQEVADKIVLDGIMPW